MKKKLLDRRGAAIELAILMMVFSIFITTIVLTTALLQNTHKAKAELGIKQDIFLEQLGEDFVDAVTNDKLAGWKPEYNGATIPQETVVTHIWVKSETIRPTCVSEGYTLYTCTLCEETKKDDIKSVLPHTILNPERIEGEGKPCQMTVKEVGYCTSCEQERENILPAAEHTWVDLELKEPTCTEEGHREQYCSVCGTTQKIDITPAKGHTPDGEGEVINPTCTENGVIIYTCEICTEQYREVGEKATGHDYVVDATETTSCKGTQTCKKCSDQQPIELHNWGEFEGSCTGSTVVTATCSDCGLTQEKEIPAIEHEFGDDGFCTMCGINKEETRYSLIVIKLKNGSYMLQVDTLKGKISESAEDGIVDGDVPADDSTEYPEEGDICSAGGSLVLKITISQLEGTYTITEWSKK